MIAPASVPRDIGRFRMDVVCETVSEAVTHAGGLICDRAMAGWDVSVFTTSTVRTGGDYLALRIVGATRVDGAVTATNRLATTKPLRAVVVSGNLYRDDIDVRSRVEDAMDDPLVEVLLWHEAAHKGSSSDARRTEMSISRAAIAFRNHAAAAANLEPVYRTSEVFSQLQASAFNNCANGVDVDLLSAAVRSR
jgi:hypothetical protein